jgi:hypothetical protein
MSQVEMFLSMELDTLMQVRFESPKRGKNIGLGGTEAAAAIRCPKSGQEQSG